MDLNQVQFCHIAPTKYIDLVSDHPRHLVLAHLVESDEQYVQEYLRIKRQRPDTTFIMDNSAFELFKAGKPMFDSSKLIELGKKIQADYIVMSDYPKQNWTVTRDKAIEMADTIHKAGFKTFYVPQSKLGDVAGLITSMIWGIQNRDLVDLIGVSILACPIALGIDESKRHSNQLQRYVSRSHVMQLLEDVLTKYTDVNNGNLINLSDCHRRFHMLGMVDGPNEIELMRPWIEKQWIASWDSSSAIWHGLNGISYDYSPTGLINGKLETPVDFNFELSEHNQKRCEIASNNVQYIDVLLEQIQGV